MDVRHGGGAEARPISRNNRGFAGYIYCPEYKGGVPEDACALMNPAPLANVTCIGVGPAPRILATGAFVLRHSFEPALFMRQLIEERRRR